MILEAQTALGAPFGEARPVAGLSRPGFEVTERGDLGCIMCTMAVDGQEGVTALASVTGMEIPRDSGPVTRTGEHRLIWLSPRSWLILCPPSDETNLTASINAATKDRRLLASAFTDYLCWLALEGEGAEDALRQGSFISLGAESIHVEHAKRTLVGGIPIIIYRDATTRWILGVERSRTWYFVDWLRALEN